MYNSISRANDDLANGECARMLIDRKYTYPDQPIKWEYTACSRTATAPYFACVEPYATESMLDSEHHFLKPHVLSVSNILLQFKSHFLTQNIMS